jgi:hypothetical protein
LGEQLSPSSSSSLPLSSSPPLSPPPPPLFVSRSGLSSQLINI